MGYIDILTAIGSTGSSAPTDAVLLGGKDGANLQAVTAASNGNAGNECLHTQTPDSNTASTSLGALNASVTLKMAGLASAGFKLSAGTLIGTLTAECSLDGGTTWDTASFFDPVNSSTFSTITFASSNTAKAYSILPIGGSSHVRVRVSAYTSGSASSLINASQVTAAAGTITTSAFGTVTNTYPNLTGNTPTLILAANPNRKFAYISNNSGSVLNIQFGSSTGLSSNTGRVVQAKDVYEIKGDNLYTGPIYGYCAGNIVLSVSEGTP